jgi:hypothetical protein
MAEVSDEAVIAITSASSEMLGFELTSSDHLSGRCDPTFTLLSRSNLFSSFPEWVSSIALARTAGQFVKSGSGNLAVPSMGGFDIHCFRGMLLIEIPIQQKPN